GTALLGLLAGCVLTAAFFLFRPTSTGSSADVVRFNIDLPKDQELLVSSQSLAISPDGKMLAYLGDDGDRPHRVYLRKLQSLDRIPLEDTSETNQLFFSPDGLRLGFQIHGGLKKISVDGGVSGVLTSSNSGYGACWMGNSIYF